MFQAKSAHLGHGLTPGLPASLLGAILRLLSFDPKSKMVGATGIYQEAPAHHVLPPAPNLTHQGIHPHPHIRPLLPKKSATQVDRVANWTHLILVSLQVECFCEQ